MTGNRFYECGLSFRVGLLNRTHRYRAVISNKHTFRCAHARCGVAPCRSFFPHSSGINDFESFRTKSITYDRKDTLQIFAFTFFKWRTGVSLHTTGSHTCTQIARKRRLYKVVGNQYVVDHKHSAYSIVRITGCQTNIGQNWSV